MPGRNYSVVVLGAGGVGKTSMVVQFIHGFFPIDYNPTIEDCYRHVVQLPDGIFHTVEILDTAGTHQFPAMRDLSIRSGQAFVIVYSINSEESFHEAMKICNLISKMKDGETVPMVLVGNKADLVNQRKVAKDYAGKYASEVLSCAHVETSAKFNINVGTLFTELLTKALNIVEKKDSSEKSKFRRSFKGLNNSLKIPRRFSMKRHSADGGSRAEPVQKPPSGKCVAL